MIAACGGVLGCGWWEVSGWWIDEVIGDRYAGVGASGAWRRASGVKHAGAGIYDACTHRKRPPCNSPVG